MADFDYNKFHSRSFYAPAAVGNVKKGQSYPCHNKEDERVAKELGYTSEKYVWSDWPKTMFHKSTGESRPVGKLAWSDEQNAAEVKKLGPDWTFDHVAVPEPVAAKAAADLSQSDIGVLASIMADYKLLIQRIEELEDQVADAHAQLAAIQTQAASEKP